ncbi:MAG TPA: ATP-binding protein [Verrucomicrobiae bacterium]|jgi:nitrogen-specific signal transduction histidine kinase/DNA-binding NarL/FixJ family response regulator|nr:ATP-binding protein [Verrucomicrobiae bacterium]
MKTILVLSAHPDFAEAIRASLNAEQFRIVHRHTVDEGEPLLVHGLIAACILDADLMGVECVWIIERLRRRDAKTPIIAYTELPQSDWEEEAFLRGVSHILTKPVRPRLFNSILERLWSQPVVPVPAALVPTGNTSIFTRTATDPSAVARFANASQTLNVLRDFSSIMTHSLDAEAMLKKFLQFLREILSVNRAAIFLNRPCSPLTEAESPEDARRLRAAAAIGLSSGLLQHFELSLDSGIGAQVNKSGRILRRDSDEARADGEAQKEFDLLGAQVAVPIPDRESIIGVAVFDGRVTGEPLVNVELEMIFHLLEQVGLALRNIWLHDQLAGNHEMMTDVLRELSSACIVFGRDLKVLHANKAAKRHFGRKNERTGGLEFSDLPQVLGAKVYQVLKTGAALEPFRYEPENSPGTTYNVSVVPFQRGKVAMPSSVLLTADDLSQSEQLRKLEVEAANLRLVRTMADRLAHEIGNAMVPLSTHQQLLAEKFRDAEFRESLDHALAGGVKRVSRLLNQMRFLARDGQLQTEVFGVEKLIEEAYQDATQQHPMEGAQLKFENNGQPLVVTGDRAALKHALSEILLNALQANPKSPQVGVKLQSVGGGDNSAVTIEVQDNGVGFSAEAARKIPSPFYTTRNVGLGLGLAVSQKIIETHHGKLEIVPSPSGLVRISLPAESTLAVSV